MKTPFNVLKLVECFYPETPLFINHTYLSGSLRNGLKHKIKFLSLFPKTAVDNIISILRSQCSLNNIDDHEITKGHVVSIPLSLYKELLNKRIFNQHKMKEFINFYLKVKSFNDKILSTITIPTVFNTVAFEKEVYEGSSFSSEMQSAVKWLKMRNALQNAFRGDKDAQEKIMNFLEPTFDFAEEHAPNITFNSDKENLPSLFFKPIKINGFIRLDLDSTESLKNINLKNSYKYELPHYSNNPYLFVNHIYTYDVNNKIKVIITENVCARHYAFSTIVDQRIKNDTKINIDETNWIHYVPTTHDNGEEFKSRYSVFIVDTELNQSKRICNGNLNGIEDYQDAELQAIKFINELAI